MMETLESLAKAGVFTAVFAFIGWVFVFFNSRSLARQSEANSISAAIEKMLQEVSDENNKFWREVKPEESNTERSRLFNAYINLRCDFIEEKLQFLNEKCQSIWHTEIDHSQFQETVIDLIAQIRDRSTLDSESAEKVKDKVERVLEINFLSLSLYTNVHDFLRSRYMTDLMKV